MAILGLLNDKGPKTGYEIRRYYTKTIKHLWNVSNGQLYPTLRRMTQEGLLRSKTLRSEKTANKILYTITEKGREAFLKWLKEPVNRFEVMRELFLLKFMFFGELNPSDHLHHLAVQEYVYQRLLDEFMDIGKLFFATADDFQKRVYEVGVIFIQLRLFWLARLRNLIENNAINKPLVPPEIMNRLSLVLEDLIHYEDKDRIAKKKRKKPETINQDNIL